MKQEKLNEELRRLENRTKILANAMLEKETHGLLCPETMQFLKAMGEK